MKVIKGFQGNWLKVPVDIVDNEKGIVQMRLTAPITEKQQQLTIKYLIDEGFIEMPQPPKDDYKLNDDWSNLNGENGDELPPDLV